MVWRYFEGRRRSILLMIIVGALILITAVSGFYIYQKGKDEISDLVFQSVQKELLSNLESENVDFFMIVEDRFYIEGKGTLVAGKIVKGDINVGDMVQLVGFGKTHETSVTFVDKFSEKPVAGDSIGVFLKDIKKEDVEIGKVLIKLKNTDGNINSKDVSDAEIANDLLEAPFLLAIEDSYNYIGKGTMATGRIIRGEVNVNDEVEVVGMRATRKTVVTYMESFRKSIEHAKVGDNIGIILKDVNLSEIERGQVIAKPNSIVSKAKFKGQIYIYKKEEGDISAPIDSKSTPEFYFRTKGVAGKLQFPEGVEKVALGETLDVEIELETPMALEIGLEFSIRDNGRTIGAGKVIKISE